MSSDGLLRLIGNTPLVELPTFAPRPGVHLFAKIEGHNPSGSIKDRVALAMIEAAEAEGRLRPGDLLVEASSGNTGIALAMVGRRKGYRVRVVMPEYVVPGIADLLELLDAEIEWCASHAGLKGAIDRAARQAGEPGVFAPGQFTNPANERIHYQTTGREILTALPQVDLFVAGIGTAGTVMGVGRRLREANPDVRLVGVEAGHGEKLQGLQNIEDAFAPPLLDLDRLNGRIIVENAAAISMTRRIARQEGILAGISGGACLVAALRAAETMRHGNVVVMFSDSGWKYLPARPWDAAHHGDTELENIHWW